MAQVPVDPVTARAEARIGLVLRGKWRLDRLLGVGGMAAVYAATHRNGKRGAVKMLHLELSTNLEARQRFLREGYAANAVGHPGAVSVLDDDVAEDGSVFLVMELLEGHSVADRAESCPGSKLEPAEVLAIADGLLDILVAAHDKGIVHRDLKPENLFLTRDGQVKVLDFGLARLQGLARASQGGRLTTAGNAMGTPAFMPPEQALGNWDAVDARSDLWAVGATMFTLLAGRLVHVADSVNKVLLAAMTKPAPALATVAHDVPPVVAAVVDRALAFDAKDRWQSASAMRDAVRRARAQLGGTVVVGSDRSIAEEATTQLSIGPIKRAPGSSSLGPTASEPRRAARVRGVIGGAVVLAVLGVAAALVLLLGRGAPQPTGVVAGPVTDPPATTAPQVAPASAAPTVTAAEMAKPAQNGEAPAVTPAPTVSASATASPGGAAPRGRAPTATSQPQPRPASPAKKADPLDRW